MQNRRPALTLAARDQKAGFLRLLRGQIEKSQCQAAGRKPQAAMVCWKARLSLF
jgi:hypothetical protein